MTTDNSTQPAAASTNGAANWQLDAAHSSVSLSHKTIWNLVTVKGGFEKLSGSGDILADGSARGRIEVDAASINTKNAKRDEHLRSADFFLSEEFPVLTFELDNVAVTGADAAISGTLTVRDQTRPVTVNGTVSAVGADEISLDAELPVNRGHHGMSFNQLGMMSLDNIITIHAVFAKA
jgi:polyisoprenoid-binding protein YceI